MATARGDSLAKIAGQLQYCDRLVAYEWTTERGVGVISSWRLPPKARGRLNSKLDRILAQPNLLIGTDAAPHVGVGFYKLKAFFQVQMRPFFIPGPRSPRDEITFLVTAIEKDNRLSPDEATILECCGSRTRDILDNSGRRKEYRRLKGTGRTNRSEK